MAEERRLTMEAVRRRAGAAGPGTRLAIGAAANRLATTPRMLRYRENLGLLPGRRRGGGHRVFGERELLAAACAAEIEQRYDVSPKSLAFALHVLADPDAQADVRLLGALAQRLAPTAIAALDFEAQKGRRLLHMDGGSP
ncbi:MAG TPA: MerR family DNA-binding transcriptional regulator [Mycobacteriales bacterium]|nr:MerR family DNA-binding transcriptional regulator [Mycobacteriales bacterium]